MNRNDSRMLLGRRDLLVGFGTVPAGMALLQNSVAEEIKAPILSYDDVRRRADEFLAPHHESPASRTHPC